MEIFKLNDGQKMPLLGIGTYMVSPTDCEPAIEHALKNNYRLIDTANIYMNEKAIGRGIKKSGVNRSEIFLTSKLWPTEFNYEKAKKAIDDTLTRLDTAYLDLLLLHQQYGDYLGAWKAMEEAVVEGKINSIGLSNFDEEHLMDVISHEKIMPAVLQTECHPYLQEKKLKNLLKHYDIALEAWYPLGHANKKLLNEEVISRLAKKYGKSNVQVILRWHTQIGNIVIPGSKNPKHIESNIDIFDFALTQDEINEISKLDKNKRYFKVPGFMKKIMFTSGKHDFNKQT